MKIGPVLEFGGQGPCGRVRSVDVPGSAWVGEYRLSRAYRHRAHTHAHRGFALGLSGMYAAALGRDERCLEADDVLIFPDGATHREWAGVSGAHCLLVQIEVDRFHERATETLFQRADLFHAPALGRLGRLIAVELATQDDASAIAVEALVADLVAEMQTRRWPRVVEDDRGWVYTVRDRLEAEYLLPPSLSALAATAGRSREHLARTFRCTFGQTIGDFVRRRRLDHAARRLVSSDAAVAHVAHESGFADQSHFTRWFRRRYRMTPAQYRRARFRT